MGEFLASLLLIVIIVLVGIVLALALAAAFSGVGWLLSLFTPFSLFEATLIGSLAWLGLIYLLVKVFAPPPKLELGLPTYMEWDEEDEEPDLAPPPPPSSRRKKRLRRDRR